MFTNINRFQRSADEMDFGGIFNSEDINLQTAEDAGSSMDPDFYSPTHKHKKAVNNTYTARLRIVPNVFDKNLSKYEKYMYYLKVGQENGFYVDCTSNWGEKNNIITTAFFFLKESDDVMLKSLHKQFARKQYWFSLVQIMKDIQDEELFNKIKIFRYPSHINKLIEAMDKGDVSLNKPPVKVLDLFNGRDLFLKINEKTYDDNGTIKKMTSYEESSFDGSNTAISLDGGNTRLSLTNDPVRDKSIMTSIFTYLKENSPSMDKVKAKKWDDEMEQKVMETVRAIINDDKVFGIISNKAQYKGKSYPKANKPADIIPHTSTESVANDMGNKKTELQNNLQSQPVTQSQPSNTENFEVITGETINFDEL